jgi:hypothetical protein
MRGVSYPEKTQTIHASLDTSAKDMSKSFAADLDSTETALDTRTIELVATEIRAEQY